MRSNVKKFRICAVCLTLMFVFTTALGLLAFPLRGAYAAEGGRAAQSNILKFKQIAAGEDFVIALTYDDDLYGWSLNPDAPSKEINTRGTTLGTRYPKTPTKIDVRFSYITYDSGGGHIRVGETAQQESLSIAKDGDKIKQIAATRTAAAFITQAGLIYTWGSESTEPVRQGANDSTNLLLRPLSTNTTSGYGETYSAYEPGIIDYSYNSGEATYAEMSISPIAPIGGANGSVVISNQANKANAATGTDFILSASEYNFMLYYSLYVDNNNHYDNYIWGQSLYGQRNNNRTQVHNFIKGHPASGSQSNSDSQLHIENRAYLGDGNIYYIDSDSATSGSTALTLNVRGKNYTVSKIPATATVDDTEDPGEPEPTDPGDDTPDAPTVAGYKNSFALTSGTRNGITSFTDAEFGDGIKLSDATTLGWQPLGAFNISNSQNVSLVKADGSAMSANTAELTKFSAGNGYGYLINSGSKIEFWGDNSLGQKGNITTGDTRYVQVVAGKVLSGKPILEGYLGDGDAIVTNIVEKAAANTGKWENGTLKEDYYDGTTLISAALSDANEVTVFGAYKGITFSDSQAVHDKLAGKNVGKSTSNKVAALAGGYDNNLFVLSSLGKMYRLYFDISDTDLPTVTSANIMSYLKCEAYDEFTETRNGNVVDIVNWEVDTDVTLDTSGGKLTTNIGGKTFPSVTFLSGYNTQKTVSTAIVGLDVEGAESSKLLKGDADDAHVEVKPKDVVVNNNSGDVYRMLIPKGQSLITSANLSEISNPDGGNWDLEFYWKNGNTVYNTPIDTEIALRYFDIAFEYNNGIQFTITPKRSTAGKSVLIRYWVGRYDSINNAGAVTTANTENFVVYDEKRACIEVSIGDTALEQVFEATGTDGLSSLPLLDTNNPFNNTYSIAAMDVSTGLDEMLKEIKNKFGVGDNYITVSGSADSVSGESKTKLLDAVYNADSGFPRSTKIKNGKLGYYGVQNYYNDVYKYFIEDIDGDNIDFDEIVMTNPYVEYFTCYKSEVVVTVPLSDLGLLNPDRVALQNLFTKTDANGQVSQFDNLYGLTMSITVDSGVATDLVIRYNVITVTALKSMPDSLVSYTNGDVKAPKLKMAKELGDNATGDNEVMLTFNDATAGTVTFNNVGSVQRSVEVFVQSSLSIKEITNNGAFSESGKHEFYGDSQAENDKNIYTFNRIDLYLGNNGGSGEFTLNIAQLFEDASNICIYYEGKNELNQPVNDLEGLQATFGSGLNAIELSKVDKQSVTIKAYRVVNSAEFTLQLRRVQPGYSSNEIGEDIFSGNNEIIYLKFDIYSEFDESMYFSLKTNAGASYDVDEILPVSLLARTNATADFLTNSDLCTIEYESNNTNIAEVTRESTTLVIKGKNSGVANISYAIKLYGRNEYVLRDSFKVKVTTLCVMTEVQRIIDRTQMYFTNLRGYLATVNNLDTQTTQKLEPKGDNPFRLEEYRTTDENNQPLAPEQVGWKTTDKISFLSTVEKARDGKSIIMTIADEYDVTKVLDSRVVVTFTDGTRDYNIAFEVAPAAMDLRDGEVGDILNIEINKAAKRIFIVGRATTDSSDMYVDDNGNYVVSATFFGKLLSKMQPDKYSDTDEYVIVATNVQESKYMEVTMDSVTNATQLWITPLYPTTEELKDGCTVQVSLNPVHRVSDDSNGSTSVMLLNFNVRVSGIKTVLEKDEYLTILLIAFFSVLLLLIIIFFIRMGVYWKKKAEQRKIIKKNQTLIKMREKMHNKTEANSRKQLVRTKLKMEDPKYARMFDEMRRERESQTGITLDNSLVAQKADKKVKAEKSAKKKKKGSLEELQAQIEAKREAVARMQAGDFTDLPDGMAPVVDVPVMDAPVDGVVMDTPVTDVPVFTDENLANMTAEQLDEQLRATLGEDPIIFEAMDPDQNGGNQ